MVFAVNAMKRMDRWKEPVPLLTVLSGEDKEVSELFAARSRLVRDSADPFTAFGLAGFLRASREVIFQLREGRPYFVFILHSINASTLRLEVGPSLEALPPEDGTLEDDKEHVLEFLAMAAVAEVPVYPDSEIEESALVEHYRQLWSTGFLMASDGGEKVRYKLKISGQRDFGSISSERQFSITETYSPAEWAMFRDAAMREIRHRDEAGRVLGALRYAIAEFSELIDSRTRNENALQRCITANPVLLGPEYRRIIPKHRLGAEYEVDYALERASGLIDLVEIEASTHSLFTKKGDPTKHLVHAEQQVLDWLDWVEANGGYARNSLPGLLGPTGYVVIGRRLSLSETDKARLARRNRQFGNKLVILTYDDLLDRAQVLLRLLLGQSSDEKELEA